MYVWSIFCSVCITTSASHAVFPISCLPLSLWCPHSSTQRVFVTAAVVVRGFWIRTSVFRAPGSVCVCQATPVYSVRTVRRDTSLMAPAAACPVPATPSAQWTTSVTGQTAFPAFSCVSTWSNKPSDSPVSGVSLLCQHTVNEVSWLISVLYLSVKWTSQSQH